MIYLGADHAGYTLKERIKAYLDVRSISYVDMGAGEMAPADDYPDYAAAVAKKVGASREVRGILLCGAGNGMAIAANKFRGVRAAVAWNAYTAKKSVEDDHANVLVLAARVLAEREALGVVRAWLAAKPSKAQRHVRRVGKIKKLEAW
ncbi:MAG: RpiB/LacA/LacB family sugar-phosphate isomerase [Parcubacteria group bacterium]|nr:RpiB/LacA/LacB family sugar-phosphate isomerase [Parcubacteria group bacterium]